ncbi:MAG: glycosyltransferase family 2 protein, partial [Actinomycetota bacterium]
ASAEEELLVDIASAEPATLPQQGSARKLNPQEHIERLDTDLVSIVIPAKDEEGFIGLCLDSILSQDEQHLQVIVVDGGSSDGTSEIVDEYAARDPRVLLLSGAGQTIPGCLNTGLLASRGRWLIRVDAHSTIPPGYVSTLVEHLRTGAWGGVGGRKDGVATSPTGRAIAAALSSMFGVGKSVYHHGTKTQVVDHVPYGAYPTALLQSLGGWDERLLANEDFELDYRIRREGHRLLFDPNVVIAWRSRQKLGELFRQYQRYGRGKARVAALHPRSLKPRHMAAPVLVAFWLIAGGLGFLWPWLFALALIPYAIALLLASVFTARKVVGWAARRALPGAFLAMHLGWGIGFWEGAVAVAARRIRKLFSR